MSANDHLEDVLSEIFANTEGIPVLDGRSSQSMCASVECVEPHVGAPASHMLLRAIADVYKSLFNRPSTNADKDSQVKSALVLPMRRSVEPKKNTIQVAADNSPETGDSISLGGDMDSGDDASEKNIHNTSDSKDENTQFIDTMDRYNSNAFLAKNFYTEGLLNNEDEISKTNNGIIIPPESKELNPKENEPATATEKVLDNEVQRLSNTSEETITQVVIIIQEGEKKKKRKSVEVLDPPVVKKRKRYSL